LSISLVLLEREGDNVDYTNDNSKGEELVSCTNLFRILLYIIHVCTIKYVQIKSNQRSLSIEIQLVLVCFSLHFSSTDMMEVNESFPFPNFLCLHFPLQCTSSASNNVSAWFINYVDLYVYTHIRVTIHVGP
jgi:hypothetical protein